MDREDLKGTLIVAVNPRLAYYCPETGFRLGVTGESDWQSPLRGRVGKHRAIAPYRRKTVQEHVGWMQRVYEYPFYDPVEARERPALAEELAYAARRLETRFGWRVGTFDRLARLSIALHDLGKLDARWQEWAHRWQEEVGMLREENLTIPDDYLAAHTDFDEQNEEEKALSRKLRRMKPNHAAESAAAAMDWLLEQAGDQALARAALTAILRHHSAGASGRHGPFRAHAAATRALMEALAQSGLEAAEPAGIRWTLSEGELARRLIRPKRERELLPYLFLVRMLRLADQRSQKVIGSIQG